MKKGFQHHARNAWQWMRGVMWTWVWIFGGGAAGARGVSGTKNNKKYFLHTYCTRSSPPVLFFNFEKGQIRRRIESQIISEYSIMPASCQFLGSAALNVISLI